MTVAVRDASVMSRSAAPAQSRWLSADLLLGLGLSVVAALGSFHLSARVPAPVMTAPSCVDVWFEADAPYIFDSMTHGDSQHHRRSRRHPLFSLVSRPAVRVVQILPLTPLQAVRVVMALVTALWAATLFALLRVIGCRRPEALCFTAVAIVSAPAVFWFSVSETWGFGSLTILLALLIVAIGLRRALSTGWYLLASALTLSMTTTNWMTGLVILATRLRWRRALAYALATIGVVVACELVQKQLFPHAALRPKTGQTSRYIFQLDSGGPLMTTQVFFAGAMVMPKLMQTIRSSHARALIPALRLTAQHAPPGSGSPWGAVAVILWLILLGLGAWGALTTVRLRPFVIVAGLTLVGHFLLHNVYGGEEVFLYSLHWAPVLVVVAACSVFTPARRVALALAALLVIAAGVNNVRALDEGAALLRREPAVMQAQAQQVNPVN